MGKMKDMSTEDEIEEERGNVRVPDVVADEGIHVGSKRRRERLARSILTGEGIIDRRREWAFVLRNACLMVWKR